VRDRPQSHHAKRTKNNVTRRGDYITDAVNKTRKPCIPILCVNNNSLTERTYTGGYQVLILTIRQKSIIR